MTAAFVAGAGLNTGSSGANLGVTNACNTTNATLIVVIVNTLVSAGFGTLSDSAGNSWTKWTSQTDQSGTNYIAYYSCVNPITSATHTFTLTGTGCQPSVSVAAFSRANWVIEGNNSGNGGSSSETTVQPGSLTPAIANEVVVSGVMANSGTSLSISAGWTIAGQNGFSSGNYLAGGIAYQIQTAAASSNPTWTQNGAAGKMAAIIGCHPATVFSFIAASTISSGTANGSTTDAMNTTSANLIVIALGQYEGAALAAITDSAAGNTWTPLTTYVDHSGVNVEVTLFYCINPTTSATHTFTQTRTSGFASLCAAAFSCPNATITVDQTSGSGGASSSLTTLAPGSITPGFTNELVVTGAVVGGGGTFTLLGGGFTLAAGAPVIENVTGIGYLIQTAIAAANPTWTQNGSANPMAAAIVSFKAVSIVQPYQQASQRFDTLPNLEYSWWEQFRVQPNPVSRIGPILQQPSQRVDPLPDYNWSWEQFTRQPIPITYLPTPFPLQKSQRFDTLPDVNYRWWEIVAYQIQSVVIVQAFPTYQPSQRFDTLSDYTTYWEQFRLQLVPITYIPTPPGTRQSSQRFNTLPDYNDQWHQQPKSHQIVTVLPVSLLQHQMSQRFDTLPDYNEQWWEQRLPGKLFPVFFVTYNTSQFGNYRVQNTAIEGYVVWVGSGTIPDLTLSPTAFATTLPINVVLTPPGSGTLTYYILTRYQDSYGLVSQNSNYTTITIDSSGGLILPPIPIPLGLIAVPIAGGKIRILAQYPGYSSDKFPATLWQVFLGTVAPDPSVDPVVYSVAVSGPILTANLGSYAPGLYYVAVVLFRNTDSMQSPALTGTVTVPAPPAAPGSVHGGSEVDGSY